MLNNVPAAMMQLSRRVVMNHPNTYNIQFFKRSTTRVDAPLGDDSSTIGGMGVLSGDDEEQISFEWAGNGYALPADPFVAGAMADHGDAVIGNSPAEFRFLIEPEEQTGHAEFFTPSRNDVFYILLGEEADSARLAFEVVDIESVTAIPPFAQRYVACRRDDLHIEAGP